MNIFSQRTLRDKASNRVFERRATRTCGRRITEGTEQPYVANSLCNFTCNKVRKRAVPAHKA